MGWPTNTGAFASGQQFKNKITPASGFRNQCPLFTDYLALVRKRQVKWLNASHVVRHGLWQRAIDDKLLGYIFARSVGVATPSVLFCDPRGPLVLPDVWPTSWGCCFAIKPLYGYNDFGVMLIEDGVDRFTGAWIRGREDVLAHLRRKGVPRLHRSTVYIETLIRPELGLYSQNATPPDFKFIMFGKKVASVAIIEARKTAGACMAWVDEDFQRTDRFGCVCKEVDQMSPCAYQHCDVGLPPKPRQWDKVVLAAKKLGERVGVHMRVDLYSGRNGLPVLGEFTPWHANGKMHCHLIPTPPPAKGARHGGRVTGSIVRRDGLTGATRSVDTCLLGRMWREAGGWGEEGGPHDPNPPAVLRGWHALMYNERAKCLAATRLLAPRGMSQGGARGGRRSRRAQ